ncbi:MAG: hypothetical protein ACUVUP_01920 [Thermaceae bacterium]
MLVYCSRSPVSAVVAAFLQALGFSLAQSLVVEVQGSLESVEAKTLVALKAPGLEVAMDSPAVPMLQEARQVMAEILEAVGGVPHHPGR